MKSAAALTSLADDEARAPVVVPSVIKWTGSKRSQATRIRELMPDHERYIEPFVGGGALLYFASGREALAGDVYGPLIGLWRLVQSSPEAVIENYGVQWRLLNDELDGLDLSNLPRTVTLPRYFYEVRDRFNANRDPLDLNFIMRTCVNGIVRFNDRGEFNNSFHLSRRGMNPSRFAANVRVWSRAIRNVEFVEQDYEQTVARARKGDFVYFDPPYAGNTQRYAEDLNLDRFFKVLEELNRRDVKWALSFDGKRGEKDLVCDIPRSLYQRHLFLKSGNSAVNKVLNGPVESVHESLYLNY